MNVKISLYLRYMGACLVFWLASASGACAVNDIAVDPIVGFWRTENDVGVIELYSCGAHICGKFHWLMDDNPSDVSRDTHNPDPDRRDRALCGQQFMGDFKPMPQGHYEGGWIYNPRSGSTYSARMTLLDKDNLDVHGYVLTPLLGESQRWKRGTEEPACITSGL